MWSELLPKCVGGTIEDHDAPGQAAGITGYTLMDDWVEVQTADGWGFGGKLGMTGIIAGPSPSTFVMRSPYMAATITMPTDKP